MSREEIVGRKPTDEACKLVVGVAAVNAVKEYHNTLRTIMEKALASELAEVNVQLVPEPTNPYDKKAIKVIINDSQIGYISKQEQRLLDEQCPMVYEQPTKALVDSWGVFQGDKLYCFVSIDISDANRFNLEASLDALK